MWAAPRAQRGLAVVPLADTVKAMLEGHAPFALWNRTGNRAVAVLLRSPLHPLLSRQLALISVTGRRSGHSYTFPVGYRRAGDRVTIPVGWPAPRWRAIYARSVSGPARP